MNPDAGHDNPMEMDDKEKKKKRIAILIQAGCVNLITCWMTDYEGLLQKRLVKKL